MSVHRVTNTESPRTVTPPNLPVPPNTYSQVYVTGLTNVLRLFFTQLTNSLNSNILTLDGDANGTAVFNASTTVNVVFSPSQIQSSSNYYVALGGNAAGYCWVSNKAYTGFTINCSSSNSNSTDWILT